MRTLLCTILAVVTTSDIAAQVLPWRRMVEQQLMSRGRPADPVYPQPAPQPQPQIIYIQPQQQLPAPDLQQKLPAPIPQQKLDPIAKPDQELPKPKKPEILPDPKIQQKLSIAGRTYAVWRPTTIQRSDPYGPANHRPGRSDSYGRRLCPT